VGACIADQLDYRLHCHQWLAAPVLGDERKEPMFNLVPFAGARREMTHSQCQVHLVGQLLQGGLPQLGATAVAATAVGRDQQFGGPRKSRGAHLDPPATDGGGGGLGGVMGDPDDAPLATRGSPGGPLSLGPLLPGFLAGRLDLKIIL
jgi:hypothetical protein